MCDESTPSSLFRSVLPRKKNPFRADNIRNRLYCAMYVSIPQNNTFIPPLFLNRAPPTVYEFRHVLKGTSLLKTCTVQKLEEIKLKTKNQGVNLTQDKLNCLFFCFYVVCSLKKEDFLENLHVLSCFVQLKSILLISRVFWMFVCFGRGSLFSLVCDTR